MPLRARLQVEFKGYDDLSTFIAKVPLPFIAELGNYLVKGGETLAQIAAEHYQDPRQWRRIAEANGIDNPLALAAGTKLRIPRRL